jgi:hypothetical protein
VNLYKAHPELTSEAIEFKLTAPANATLGKARISEASLKACKFSEGKFALRQIGVDTYAVRFYSNSVPMTVDKKGKQAKLKSSYTLKIELWAEGTYDYSYDGSPIALGYYNAKGKLVAKTKPTIVTVKVNVK